MRGRSAARTVCAVESTRSIGAAVLIVSAAVFPTFSRTTERPRMVSGPLHFMRTSFLTSNRNKTGDRTGSRRRFRAISVQTLVGALGLLLLWPAARGIRSARGAGDAGSLDPAAV